MDRKLTRHCKWKRRHANVIGQMQNELRARIIRGSGAAAFVDPNDFTATTQLTQLAPIFEPFLDWIAAIRNVSYQPFVRRHGFAERLRPCVFKPAQTIAVCLAEILIWASRYSFGGSRLNGRFYGIIHAGNMLAVQTGCEQRTWKRCICIIMRHFSRSAAVPCMF